MRARLAEAESEMAQADRYDYRIVNEDPDEASREVYDIIIGEREA